MPSRLDRQAMALCQAVYAGTGGRPQRWMALHALRLELGLELEEADQVARHAESLGWLVLNPGPELHSVAIGPDILLAVR